MCHSVTHGCERLRRDAPPALGRPGRGHRPPRLRPRAGRAGLRPLPDAGGRRRSPCRRPRWPPTCSTPCGPRVGAEHVLTDDETRRLRTRGKSTPDLLRARAGDLSDAPDAVVRPATHAEVEAVLAWAVEHHVAVVPFGGGTSVTGGLAARRDGFAGLVSLDLVRMKRLVSVDHESMTAVLEPGLRGPEAEALLAAEGVVLGHYPQSFEFATIGGFAATRSSGQSSAGYGRFDALVVGLTRGHPARLRLARLGAGQRRRPRPAPAVPRLGGRVRGDHLGDRPGAAAARGQGLRGVALGLLRLRDLRDADARAGGPAADGDPALRRDRDRDQPRPAGLDRRRVRGRLPDDHRLRGHPRRGRGQARGGLVGALLARRHPGRRGAGRGVGARAVRRAVPPRLDARRRRPRGDAGDRDVLVQPRCRCTPR